MDGRLSSLDRFSPSTTTLMGKSSSTRRGSSPRVSHSSQVSTTKRLMRQSGAHYSSYPTHPCCDLSTSNCIRPTLRELTSTAVWIPKLTCGFPMVLYIHRLTTLSAFRFTDSKQSTRVRWPSLGEPSRNRVFVGLTLTGDFTTSRPPRRPATDHSAWLRTSMILSLQPRPMQRSSMSCPSFKLVGLDDDGDGRNESHPRPEG